MNTPSSRQGDSRPRLGRGLAALLGESQSGDWPQTSAATNRVPIEFLKPSARNPRKHFDETELEELAASIKERGIIQPVIVRPIVDVTDAYEIVAGERRWRAAQRAGLQTIPIVPLQITDQEVLEFSIIENVQRTDLQALEEAQGYAQLAADYGYNHTDIGRIIGKSRSYVANMLRLLALPAHTRDLLAAGSISAGHARALLAVTNPDAIADRIVRDGLSVRDVERLSDDKTREKDEDKGKPSPNAQLTAIENRLSSVLGASVKIQSGKRTHELRIKLSDKSKFEYLCDILASLDNRSA